MIVVYEPGFSDGGHVPFNAGFLEVIRIAFPGEKVLFFGAPAHIEEIKKQAGRSLAASIAWKEISPPAPDVTYVARFFRETKILWDLLRMFPKDSPGPLLLTSTKPATLLALKLVQRFHFADTKFQVVLHGLLGGITGRRYRHPIRRFQQMRTALTILGNRNIQYLVLEESLRNALLKNLPSLSGKVEVLDHPLPPNESESNTGGLCDPIRFGFLGLANESKGFPTFVKLADAIAGEYGGRVEFHAIGRRKGNGDPGPEIAALATKPGASRISRSAYIEGVKQLHFVVFPHHASTYELTFSGTLLDALAWEKPLIARKIPIFENIFSKYGDIGYLFGNDVELREVVQQIVRKPDEARYDQQIMNIRRVRSSRTPEALATDYREMCERMASGGEYCRQS